MGSQGEAKRPARPERASRRITVDGDGKPRPFMRGIMVHSLMARGVPFEEAYRTANEVRTRIGARPTVSKQEIAAWVREILGSEPFQDEKRVPVPVDITILGPTGKGLPFSKGVLSQSLLAAAIDPNDAFDVAREIERELIARDVREVDRRELRRLAYHTLSRHMGEATGERYLLWRKYQHPERPVIILLGGAAGVGKTSLALEVAHRLGIGRVYSTDSVRQIMRIMLSKDLVPAIYGSSYDAWRLIPADSLGDDPVVEGFRAQASTVSVGIRGSVDRAIAENTSLVMDGVSIVPGMLDVAAYADRADVIFLVVATLDEEAFKNRFSARAADQKQRAPHRYLENLDAILRIQEHFLELADRYDVPIVDNVSFDRSVLLIIRHVAEALRKKRAFDVAELL
ncbi:MAG TPA: ATP cone domain-containing protein [Myxococcota bacterium]|jgi:2-phosphoglycerate kinase